MPIGFPIGPLTSGERIRPYRLKRGSDASYRANLVSEHWSRALAARPIPWKFGAPAASSIRVCGVPGWLARKDFPGPRVWLTSCTSEPVKGEVEILLAYLALRLASRREVCRKT